MKALVAVLILVSAGASAQQAVNPLVTAKIKADACVQAGIEKFDEEGLGAALERFESSGEARTPGEWTCVIVGTFNRSQTIKVLGKPSQAMAGMLFFKDKARDPDTGEPLTLQVAFLNGEDRPATHVSYFTNGN